MCIIIIIISALQSHEVIDGLTPHRVWYSQSKTDYYNGKKVGSYREKLQSDVGWVENA